MASSTATRPPCSSSPMRWRRCGRQEPAAVALEDAHARVVLAEPWSRAEEAPEQAVLSRLDRPFGRRACDLVALLEVPTRELLGRPLTRVRAHDQHDQGRIVVELSLAPA